MCNSCRSIVPCTTKKNFFTVLEIRYDQKYALNFGLFSPNKTLIADGAFNVVYPKPEKKQEKPIAVQVAKSVLTIFLTKYIVFFEAGLLFSLGAMKRSDKNTKFRHNRQSFVK